MSANSTIFFGVGPGRCGTMTLANFLNAEDHVLCTHEGKIRRGTESGQQWLPFLTMENYLAYADPGQAQIIFREKRNDMSKIAERENLRAFGDIAYNNAPFTAAIPFIFPQARLIVMVRDGRDFVRSAYTAVRPDPTPVGWLDIDTSLTPLEKYISFGRLRPLDAEEPGSAWQGMGALERNAWLWAETMRLIHEGLANWDDEKVLILRFEDFFAAPLEQYPKVRAFLGLDDAPMPEKIGVMASARINRRGAGECILPPWREWTKEQAQAFMRQAEGMMARWGYL